MKLDTQWVRSLGTSRSSLDHLFDQPVSDRLWLARALPDLDDELSVYLGSALVKDPDRKVRAEVARGLGEIGYRTLIHEAESRLARQTLLHLATLSKDEAWEVRAKVPWAALQYGSESVMPMVHGLRFDEVTRVREIAQDCYQELTALHPNTAAKLKAEPQDPTTLFLSSVSPPLGRFWTPRARPTRNLIVPAASSTSSGEDDSGGGDKGGDDSGAGAGAGGSGDEPQYLEQQGESRYVNSWFVGHADPLQPLDFKREYELGIEVAPQVRVGSFTTGDPEFKEPPFEDAASIEITVAIVSDDFSIADKAAARMTLPADPTERSQRVSFKVTPLKNNQDVYIHVFFYRQNNLFHEALIGAHVQVRQPLSGAVTTTPFKPVARFQAPVQGPRDVNLQVIELRGSYRLVLFYDFGDTDFDVFSCTVAVNRDKIVELLAGVRQDLVEVVNTAKRSSGGPSIKVFFDGEVGSAPITEERLPHLFRIDDDLYEQALKGLARAGGRLYVNLFESGSGPGAMAQRASEFGQKLRALSARQPLRMQVLSDEFFIPWNLLFDGEFAANGPINPLHFWGFRHLIEEVPGSSRAERIDPVVPVSDKSMPIAINVNVKAIPDVLTTPQRSAFRGWGAAVAPIERLTENEVLEALQGKKPQGEIEYFYCHAGVEGTSQSYFDKSYLGLTGSQNGLTLGDIKIAMIGREFASKPVVFLNACESVQMDGRFYDGFVPQFLQKGARVVLGTDCEVPSLFAAHFGTQFLQALLKGEAVGAALLAQRKDLLERYQNPLGLIYRVFGNAETRLSRALI